MMMSPLRASFFFFCSLFNFFVLPSLATEQIPDKLIYEGQTHCLFATPLEWAFTPENPKPDFDGLLSTACHRGYVATWEIKDGVLLLTRVTYVGSGPAKDLPMEHYLPQRAKEKPKAPIHADWFSGVVRVGQGDWLSGVREEGRFFEFKKGKLVAIKKEHSPTLTVVSYNIKHGRGMDGRVDLDRAAAVLRKTGADLIALQEIDKNCTRSGNIDIAKELGTRLGMEHRFGKFMDFQGGEYGLAILSRYPILKTVRHPLPEGAEPRCALEVMVFPEGISVLPLAFVCVHNDWTSAAIRKTQMEALLPALRLGKGHPVIIAGDFNATREESERALGPGWKILEKTGSAETFPSTSPTTEIDHIATHNLRHKKVDHAVIDERLASDHRPITATFTLWWRDRRSPAPRFLP